MEESFIQSRRNEQVKNLVKLRERKHRDRQERFLVEGLRETDHAHASGFHLETLYFCPEYFPSEAHSPFIETLRRQEAVTLVRLSREAFAKASYREGPDGVLAVARQRAYDLSALKLNGAPLLLVLEGIEKPGNLGALLRIADGAGVDAVVLVDCVLDLYNPNAIRASQGLVFTLPVVHADRQGLANWLADHSIRAVATTPGTRTPHWSADYRLPTAFFLGSESDGLSDFWLKATDTRIRIPMAGRADSLNVSAAAAVCLYEARRQREAPE